MSQSESNNSDCEERIERAKGIFDGSETIDEMIDKLDEKKEELQNMKNSGWVVADEVVVNDYAHLEQRD